MHKLSILKNVELIQKILEMDELPDVERFRKYYEDFTKEPLPLSDDQLRQENMPTYQRIKKTMKPFLHDDLQGMGRNAPESCFSKDDPVEVFLNYLREYVAREVVSLEDEGVDKKIVAKFLSTKRKDMSVDDYVKSAVKKLHELYKLKAIIDMEKDLPAASDFNNSKGINYPRQNFKRKWKHDLDAFPWMTRMIYKALDEKLSVTRSYLSTQMNRQ